MREAYITGVAQMILFNEEYIMDSDLSSSMFKKPQYLHVVIGTDIEPASQSKVSQMDINIMNMNLVEHMRHYLFEMK